MYAKLYATVDEAYDEILNAGGAMAAQLGYLEIVKIQSGNSFIEWWKNGKKI